MADETRIERLLDRWEEGREAGREPTPEELCRDDPSLLDEVRRRIGALRQMDRSWFDLEETTPHGGKGASLHDDGRTIPELTGEISVEARYDDLEFVGRGGLGIVFRARDEELRRSVALKFMQAREAIDPAQRARFAIEAEITSRLDHPGVVPVYGIGSTSRGRPFYAMRYIRGADLDSAILEFHQTPNRDGVTGALARTGEPGTGTGESDTSRIRDFVTVSGRHRRLRELLGHYVSACKTIAYAHQRGVVHGDLKPHNIMLGRFGETLVVDWGQAIIVDRADVSAGSGEYTELRSDRQDSETSHSNRISPAYMSPEQARGERPGFPSDIYSLGATLFKLLAGRPAVSGNLTDLRDRVLRGDLPKPRSIDPRIPGALEAICLKAMSVDPAQRYPTAMALAQDVERFLADDPVTAYREPARDLLVRWMRRHRASVFAGFLFVAATVLLSLLTAVGLGVAARNESLARSNAEQAQLRAESHRQRNLALSAIFLSEAISNEIDLRWRILEAEATSPRLRELVAALNAAPEDADTRARLQAWLDGRAIGHREIAWKSWLVNDRSGIQQARSPVGDTIGRNFRYRDYFHARGKDLTGPELDAFDAEGSPILGGRQVHMSAVFFSDNTDTAMVAFSVPIWSGPPEEPGRSAIGLLGMTIEVGQFELPAEVRLLLVDTRNDQFEGLPGLVLHATGRNLARRDQLPPRLDGESLALAESLRRQRGGTSRMASPAREQIVPNFLDPIGGGRTLAALAPVLVQGRSDEIADTGWLVIVEDDSVSADPAASTDRSD